MNVLRASTVSILLISVALVGCTHQRSGNESVPVQQTQPIQEGVLGACGRLRSDVLKKITGASAVQAVGLNEAFVIPGTSKTPALGCLYKLEGSKIRSVHLRSTSIMPQTLFGALGRIKSPALEQIPPPRGVIEAYWEVIGQTLWLRTATEGIAIGLNTDDESAMNKSAALALSAALSI